MSFGEIFYSFWWLMFPIFGMAMGMIGMFQHERRSRDVIQLIKSYVDQGKEPPAELLKLASQASDSDDWGVSSPGRKNNSAWTFVVFAALAAGFGVGWWISRAEDYAFAFLIVTVTMSVLALGSLLILIFGRK